MASHLFVKRGEKLVGPVSLAQIKSSIESGKFIASDKVAKEKGGPWRSLGNVPSLASLFPAAATVSPSTPAPSGDEESSSRLVKCEDCGKQISRRAESCPHCGAPVGRDDQSSLGLQPDPLTQQPLSTDEWMHDPLQPIQSQPRNVSQGSQKNSKLQERTSADYFLILLVVAIISAVGFLIGCWVEASGKKEAQDAIDRLHRRTVPYYWTPGRPHANRSQQHSR